VKPRVGRQHELYTESTSTLEVILSLTRELGVNLAGVEIILNMREKMNQMQTEFERFFEYLRTHADEFSHRVEIFSESEALIPFRASIKSVMNIKKRSKDKFRFRSLFPFPYRFPLHLNGFLQNSRFPNHRDLT
jgi:DNA-binding transcriptional MerR regulator